MNPKSTKITRGTRWGWTGNTSILCFLCALWQNKAGWEGLNPQMHQAMGVLVSIYTSTHLFWRIVDRGLESLSYKRSGGDDVFRQLAGLVAKSAEVALHLNAMPKVWGLVKKRSKANRHGRGDGAFTQYNFEKFMGSNARSKGFDFNRGRIFVAALCPYLKSVGGSPSAVIFCHFSSLLPFSSV